MKQVILMRRGSEQTWVKEIAQGAHASMGAVLKDLNHPFVQEWLSSSFKKIVVKAYSKEELEEACNCAKELGLPFCLIEDNGATEFHGVKTATACAIGPGPDELVDKVTSNKRLY